MPSRKDDDVPIIVPKRRTWTSYAEDAPPVDDDFMAERPALMNDERPHRVVMRQPPSTGISTPQSSAILYR